MYYSIPVSEKAFKKLEAFRKDERDYVLFKPFNDDEGFLFLLIHGTEKGNVALGHTTCTLQAIAEAMVPKIKKIDASITHVYTISCYGGLQKPCTVDGITFGSMHNSHKKVEALFFSNTYGYSLDIYTEEIA